MKKNNYFQFWTKTSILLLSLLFTSMQAHGQTVNGAAASFSLRKLNSGYTGSAIQVRRNCDNATINVGFTACGDLDTVAIRNFVFGAPALGALGTTSQASFSLRKLGCSYSGNAIRIRRSCDNAETDIGFTSTGDLDTTALKNFVYSAGPLNLISTSSQVAYGLRRLRCAYSGPVVRIRRSSDNAEVDVAFNITSEVSGASVCTVTNVGSSGLTLGATLSLSSFSAATSCYVTTWYDQSGNSRNATQTSTTKQPRLVNSGVLETLNGKVTLVFSGGQTLVCNVNPNQLLASGNATTANFIFQSNNGVQGTLFSNGDLSGPNRYNIHAPWDDNNSYWDVGNWTSGGRLSGPLTWTSGSIGTFIRNGSSALVRKNGSVSISSSSMSTSASSTSNMHIGSFDGNTYYITGSISEVIAFNSALTSAELGSLEYNQSLYYGVSGPPVVSINSTAADAFVTTWYDQSGFGRNATQATLSNQPRIMNDGTIERQNGKPSLRFLSITSGLATASFTAFTTAACFNGVAKVNTDLLYNAIVSKTGSGGNANIPSPIDFYNARNVVGNGVGFVFRDVAQSFVAAKPLGIWTFRAQQSGSFDAYYNGSSNLPSGTVGTTFNDVGNPLYIGMRADGVTGLNGWISEILTFNSFPSDADRQYFEYTQALYYGISGPAYANPTNTPTGYVATWYDQSGNARHLTQSNNSQQPVILSRGRMITINGRPAMRSSSVLQTNLTGSLGSNYTGTTLTANAVYQSDTTTSNNLRLMSTGRGATAPPSDWNENGLFNINQRGGGSAQLIIERNATSPLISITPGSGSIVSVRFDGTNRQIWNNNNASGTSADNRAFDFNTLRLFQSINTPAFQPLEAFTGRMSEYVLFYSSVSNSRRTIIENNQATYYGITLNSPKYTPTDVTYNRYGNGIGFESTADSVQRTRVSDGLVIEDDASSGTNFLRNAGDYIMAGVNCNLNPGKSTTLLSNGVMERWTTDWEVKKTDVGSNGGSVRLIFDYGDYWKNGYLPSTVASNYVLLHRSSSSAVFDTLLVTSKTISGDQVIFTLNASSINTFFTIGTMNPFLSPLPIDLVSFTAKPLKDKVALNWTTAQEINVNRFEIEKSLDLKNWSFVLSTPAHGNTITEKSYKELDAKPYPGLSYYRLKSIDNNNEFEYSQPVSVRFNSAVLDVSIFPQPASDKLFVSINAEQQPQIWITDMLGRNTEALVVFNGNTAELDLSKFASGLYNLVIVSGDNREVHQILIQK